MESKGPFNEARQQFKVLIKEGSLPPKMLLKLGYLESTILGIQLQQTVIQSLPQFQKISLQMMNQESKISLFTSIVNCLSGNQIITYFNNQKAYFRRQDSSSKSIQLYFSCTNQLLSIAKNKDAKDFLYKFLIQKLLVAKMYHQEKKKWFFGVAYQSVKYRVRFDQEGPCARIHAALLNAIREKRSLRAKSDAKSSFGDTRMKEELEMEHWDETGEERLMDEERQYLSSLAEKILALNVSCCEGFQLVRNMEGGKIMSSASKNTVKVMIFLERCTIQGLIESYIQFTAWNVQVDSFKIIKKIRHNTFVGHLKMKKKNFFTAARECCFIINYFKLCPCLNKSINADESTKHYLVMTKVEDESLSGVEMFFNQTLEFSEVKSHPGDIYLNITSEIDFNVYQYFQNSLEMNLKFLEQINSISTLCHERQILQTTKSQLFQFNLCACNRQKEKSHFLFPAGSKAENTKSSMISEATQEFPEISEFQEVSLPMTQAEIFKTIEENNKILVTQKIIEIINKKVYETYYLKLRFKQQLNEGPYIRSEYHLKERKNFLKIGQKWKLTQNQQYIFVDQFQLELQKGILKLIVKQITTNLMSGKSIMSMSLPVEIFDDYSTTESFGSNFGFVPPFMHKALKEDNIEEQIKYVAIPFIFLFASNPKVGKPFNPILGQTCQGSIGGIPVLTEQISHHPPITAYYIRTDEYEISGVMDIKVDIGLNSSQCKLPCPVKVKIFKNNTEYIIKLPQLEVSGITFGDRTYVVTGSGYALEKKSGIYLEYTYGKGKKKLYEYQQKLKKSDMTGGVFKITKQAVERILSVQKKKSFDGLKHDEAIQRTSLITGKWFGDISFDGVSYKSYKTGPFPLEFQRQTTLLPSDCTFRLDVIYRRWRNFKRSNEEKEVLENIQRRDRKMREKYNKPG